MTDLARRGLKPSAMLQRQLHRGRPGSPSERVKAASRADSPASHSNCLERLLWTRRVVQGSLG